MSPEEIREVPDRIRARIRAALATWSHARGGVWYFPPWVNTLAEAARAYADLIENGQEVEFRLDSDQHWSNTLLPAFKGEGRYLVVRLEEE